MKKKISSFIRVKFFFFCDFCWDVCHHCRPFFFVIHIFLIHKNGPVSRWLIHLLAHWFCSLDPHHYQISSSSSSSSYSAHLDTFRNFFSQFFTNIKKSFGFPKWLIIIFFCIQKMMRSTYTYTRPDTTMMIPAFCIVDQWKLNFSNFFFLKMF